MNADEVLSTSHLRGVVLSLNVRTKNKLIEYAETKGLDEFVEVVSTDIFFDDVIYRALKDAIKYVKNKERSQ